MGVKGPCSTVTVGIVLGLMTASLTASLGHAQSVAVREESAVGARQALITLSVKQAPLAKVLRDIAAQANLTVAFPVKVSQSPARVTVEVRGMPLEQVVEKVLDGTGFKASVLANMIVFSERESAPVAPMAQGNISGKVIDGKTRQGLRGAAVSLSGTNKGTTTSKDGSFHFLSVVPGSYTIHVRMLGYVKTSKPVTVTEGTTASAELVMEPSVNALDQVVVTGTVVETEQRAIPNAMTVITAKDIEQRGITSIDQLFRGDVPGVFALNLGSGNALDNVAMFSRGTTVLEPNESTNFTNSRPIKTYVDGVELADAQYLSQIDPKSIERIEILTGPQASTIYGSNAINGVMQVFTKRGSGQYRPQLTATLQSGLLQNSYSPALASQHDYSAQINGVEGRISYNVGGAWTYMGPWTPAKQTSRVSGFGGLRMSTDPITVDASWRLAQTRNMVRGESRQRWTYYREIGWWTPTYNNGLLAPSRGALQGTTLGVTLGYAPVSWWSHEVVLGRDQSDVENRRLMRGYLRTSDTLLYISRSNNQRTSLRYGTTARVPISTVGQLVVSVGADGWNSLANSMSVSPASLTGTLSGTPQVSRQLGRNTGGFLQSQLGLRDALFLTYGLRAEWNPNYGEEAQPNMAPRVGIAYAKDLDTPWGRITAKLRGSYGRSTRPPETGQKVGSWARPQFDAERIEIYGLYMENLSNPDLGPETQQGGEGGLELYFGTRGALVLTRYNQTVSNLIVSVYGADSVRSLTALPPDAASNLYQSKDDDGYGYWKQSQWLNAADIRNQGWEAQATLNVGPFVARGTYSYTRSRSLGVTPKFAASFDPAGYPPYGRGGMFSYMPEHTWALGLTYSQAASSVTVTLNGVGQMYQDDDDYWWERFSGLRLMAQNAWRYNNGGGVRATPGYVLSGLNATHRFTSRAEGILHVQNLTNYYRVDMTTQGAALGRQIKGGFRLRL